MSVIAPLRPQGGVVHEPASDAHSFLFKLGNAPFQRSLSIPYQHDNEVKTAFPGIVVPDRSSDGAETAHSVQPFLQSASRLASQPEESQGGILDQSIDKLLTASGGALQFQKTPLRTAQDFSDFMHVLAKGTGWTPHVDKGLMVLRRPHAKNVATANEGPPDQAIGSHNEYGLSSHYPSYIAFFCVSAPDKGGETPLASSLRLYDRFRSEAPEYIDAVQKQGISFAIHHPRSNVEGNVGGNSVLAPNAFGASLKGDLHNSSEEEKRSVVEGNVRALAAEGGWIGQGEQGVPGDANVVPQWKRRGYSGHWLPDGSFIVVQRTPGVRPHPVFKVPSYFTNVHTRFIYAGIEKEKEVKEGWSQSLGTWVKEQQRHQTLKPPVMLPPYITGKAKGKGEGEDDGDDDFPFPQEWIDSILRITAEEQIDVSWQVGDVLLIDNLAVQHGRRPWKGDRRLLASLWDSEALQRGSKV
ncbi:hypothetical protein CBS101457_004916 [Exobasidium rhododendri]|nr:hypothetical protein CBS101457_004916 [Exobasidium rhododendri]